MAVTYPLSLPASFPVKGVTMRRMAASARSESNLTYQGQTFVWPGQRWGARLDLTPTTDRDVIEGIASFLDKLNGAEGTFLLGSPFVQGNRGTFGGTPLVAGAAQTGNDLAIDGCTALVTNWGKNGDFYQMGSGSTARLYRLWDAVDSDAGGAATLSGWPAFTADTSPADNDPVTVTDPMGVFRLAGSIPDIRRDPGLVWSGLTLDAVSEV